jgi:hypothetical protein
MPRSVNVEYAAHRPIRTRNKSYYRLAHWPLWIWVFFLSAGPIVFRLFAYGPSRWTLTWLGAVLVGTGIAAIRGQLPGVEPAPYILRFTEDKPNPLYRRICYTFAWNVVVNFVILNWIGLAVAAVTQHWYLKQIYSAGYFPIAIVIWTLGLFGLLPRVKASTAGEGHERRFFYGSVWAACVAQPLLWILWITMPRTPFANIAKLVIFTAALIFMGMLAARGVLPRTRPILPGELMVAD